MQKKVTQAKKSETRKKSDKPSTESNGDTLLFLQLLFSVVKPAFIQKQKETQQKQ